MSRNKKDVERINYTSEGHITTYRGRINKYLNRFPPHEKRIKMYEALERYLLPEAIEYEGWRERENRDAKIAECADALKAKARAMYQMIGEQNDEIDEEEEFEPKRKSKRDVEDENEDEEDEKQKEIEERNRRIKEKIENDPNTIDMEKLKDKEIDEQKLQEFVDSI